MSADLTVREYDEGDRGRVVEIHEAAMLASPLPFDPDAPVDEVFREIETRYDAPDSTFLVGEIGGEPVAVGGVQPIDDATAEIKHLRVHPDHQRRGYGSRILHELEGTDSGRGYDAFELVTNEYLTAARAFFGSHGYEETDRTYVPEAGAEFVSYRKER